jgi:hypothetical protein
MMLAGELDVLVACVTDRPLDVLHAAPIWGTEQKVPCAIAQPRGPPVPYIASAAYCLELTKEAAPVTICICLM